MERPQISKLKSCDKMLGPWQSQLCDIQGRLFENAGKAGYSSEQFIKQFMTSSLAKELDSTYNRMQWAEKNICWKNLLIDVRLHQKMGIYTITKSFTGLAMYTDTGIFLLGNQVKIFINKLLLKR